MPGHVDPTAGGVLPSWLLGPILLTAAWTFAAPLGLGDLAGWERVAIGPAPATVIAVCAVADWRLWVRRGKPWHEWAVILLLLPAIAAAVWVAVGALALELPLSRAEALGLSVGPGIAFVGLLTTTISFHGRHHPDEAREPHGG